MRELKRVRAGGSIVGWLGLAIVGAFLASVPGSRAQGYEWTVWAGRTYMPGSQDGAASKSQLNGPCGAAVDGAGNAYIADTGNHTVRRLSVGGGLTTVAGSAGASGAADGNGSQARFLSPCGVAAEASGALYVTDTGNHTIRRIARDGETTTLAGQAGAAGILDGQGPGARFNHPRGIAIDTLGNLWVADTDNHAIRKIAADGGVVTVAGAPGESGSADGPAGAARFAYPFALAADAAGNVFIGDTANYTIRKLAPDGTVTTLAGRAGAIGGTDATGAEARFSTLYGLAVDAAGNLYAVDSANCVVRKVTPAGEVRTWVGRYRAAGTRDSSGSSAQFNQPFGVAVAPDGSVFIADRANHTVRKITPGGSVTTAAGRAGIPGAQDGSPSPPQFANPAGLAIDRAGSVYVADTSNHTIRKVSPDGQVSTVAGKAGAPGTVDGPAEHARFTSPTGIAIDGNGNLYVTEPGVSLLRRITPAGEVATLVGRAGETGSADGPGATARFNSPQGVAVDGQGVVYVADTANRTIRRVTPDGNVATLAGKAGEAGANDGMGQNARFAEPVGLAVDSAGQVFVADRANHTVRAVSADGQVRTVAGRAGEEGQIDGPGVEARFSSPIGIGVDAGGNLFVADKISRRIRKIAPDGSVSTIPGGIEGYGVAPTPDGALLISEPALHCLMRAVARRVPRWSVQHAGVGPILPGDRIDLGLTLSGSQAQTSLSVSNSGDLSLTGLTVALEGDAADEFSVESSLGSGALAPGESTSLRLTFAPKFVGPRTAALRLSASDPNLPSLRIDLLGGSPRTRYRWTTLAGGAPGYAEGAGTAAKLSNPGAVAAFNGEIYVADTGNHLIRKIVADGSVKTIAGVPGQAGAQDGQTATATFNRPGGLAIDSGGVIYVADTGNHVLRKITPAGLVSTWAGTASYSSFADAQGAGAGFREPRGLALDSAGNLLVADSGNTAIRQVTPDRLVTTVAGVPYGRGSQDGVGRNARFDTPAGLAFDSGGALFVADSGNSTLRLVAPDYLVSTWAGAPGASGAAEGPLPQARFKHAQGLAVDARDDLYVADTENHTVRQVSRLGQVLTIGGLAGDAGAEEGDDRTVRFNGPCGVAVDRPGNVYVADTGNSRIVKGEPAAVAQPALVVEKAEGVAVFSGGRVDLGSLATGNRTRLAFTLRNTQPARLTGLAVTLAEGGSPDLSIASGLNTDSLELNQSAAFEVEFRATTGGIQRGVLRIRSSDPILPLLEIQLLGRSLVPAIVVDQIDGGRLNSGATIDFGPFPPEGIRTVALTIGNTGSTDLTALSAAFEAAAGSGFSISKPLDASVIATNGQGRLTIRFAPTSLGPSTATLRIASNDPERSPFVLHLRGLGTPAYLWTTLAGSRGQQGNVDGVGADASFNGPSGLAVDAAGNVYVADTGNHTLRKISPAGEVTTLAGGPNTAGAADGQGNAARFRSPSGVAVDTQGTVYVADTGNMTVRTVASSGWVATLAGKAGTQGSGDGPADQALFIAPRCLAVDSARTVYVLAAAYCQARVIAAGRVSTIGWEGGMFDRSTPDGMALDPQTNFYVAQNYHHVVLKLNPNGPPSTLAGKDNTPGTNDGLGAEARFRQPSGLAADAQGILFLTEKGNHTVRRVRPDGFVATIGGAPGEAGWGDGFGGAARFSQPGGIAVDISGNLYVADTGNARIVKGVPQHPPALAVETPAGAPLADGSVLDFGCVPLGGTSNRTFRVRNLGVLDLADVTVSVEGTPDADFTLTTPPNASVGGLNAATSLELRFAPSGPGQRTASLRIVSNDPNRGVARFGLTGTGSPPAPALRIERTSGEALTDGAAVDFGLVALAAQTNLSLRVRNFGFQDLDGLSVSVTGDAANEFPVVTNPVGPVPGPYGEAALGLRFAPTVRGSRRAVLQVLCNDAERSPFQLVLSGTGLAPTLTVARPDGVLARSGDVYDFGAVNPNSPAEVIFRLDNAGDSDLQVLDVCVDGLNAADFLVVSSPTGALSGSTGGAPVTVRFAPLGLGTRVAALHVASNDPEHSAFDLQLTGFGRTPTIVLESSAGAGHTNGGTIDFGARAVGASAERTLTLRNRGNADLKGLRFDVAGGSAAEYAVTLAAASSALPPGGIAQATIRFVPAAPGVRVATLTFAGDADVNPFALVLQGTGLPPAPPRLVLEQPPGSAQPNGTVCAFGAVEPGGRASLTFRVRNAGSSDLSGLGLTVDGPGAASFTVTRSLEGAILGPTDTALFTVQFAPRSVGELVAILRLSSNDPAEHPFQAVLRGTGGQFSDRLTDLYTWKTWVGSRDGEFGFADGPASVARFDSLAGLAVDAAGNVWVADRYNHALRRVSPSGEASTPAGLGGVPGSADGQGTAARFRYPSFVAVDPAGGLFVSDSGNHTIRKVTLEGVVSTLAGSPGLKGSSDGPAAAARFYAPEGLAADAQGNLFVADSYNHTVRKVSPPGEVTTVAGSAGQPGNVDGPGPQARFFHPLGLAVDSSGVLYLTDNGNNSIRKIALDGSVKTLAGPNYSSGTGTASFSRPAGIVVDGAGDLLVAGNSSLAVYKISPAGAVRDVSRFYSSSGVADGTGEAARLESPWGIAVDRQGVLYIADPGARIVRGTPSSPLAQALSVRLQPDQGLLHGQTVDFGAAPMGRETNLTFAIKNSSLVDLTGVSLQMEGAAPGEFVVAAPPSESVPGPNVKSEFTVRFTPQALGTRAATLHVLSDDERMGVFDIELRGTGSPAYQWTVLAGRAGEPGNRDGGGVRARFNAPAGLAVDDSGAVLVADSANHTLRAIQPDGTVNTLAGSPGAAGADDGPADRARFSQPWGIAWNGDRGWVVADTGNHTLRRLALDGAVSTLAGSPGSAGTLDGLGAAARFRSPRGVAAGAAGAIYVADADAHTLRVVAANGEVTTLAGFADSPGTNNGAGPAARFNGPQGLAIGPGGNVFVADRTNSTVRRVTPQGAVETWAGTRPAWYAIDGPRLSAQLPGPVGVAADAWGNLFVTQPESAAVRMVARSGSVLTLGASIDLRTAAAQDQTGLRMGQPVGIAVDREDNLYVADSRLHCVLKGVGFRPAGPVLAVAADLADELANGQTVDFGPVALGANVERTFTLGNLGALPLTGIAARLEPNSTADFAVTAAPAPALTGRTGRTQLTLRFAPSAVGLRASTLLIASGVSAEGSFRLRLLGAGVAKIAPALELEAPGGWPIANGGVVSFAPIRLGVGSNTLTLTLRNSGCVPLTRLELRLEGSEAGDFALLTPPVPPIAGFNTASNLTVQFTPSAPGLRSAKLRVASDDPDRPNLEIELAGTALATEFASLQVEEPPGLALTNGVTEDFGTNIVQTVSSRTFTLRNTGATDLTGLTATLAGNAPGFALGGEPREAVLRPGEVAHLTVRFTPSTEGPQQATLTLVSSDTRQSPFTIGLKGFGTSLIAEADRFHQWTCLAGDARYAGSADGVGRAARFSQPTGIAVDAQTNVWVADTDNHVIRRIAPDRVVTTVAGNPAEAGSADGVGGAARFRSPVGLAVGGDGSVYVSDNGDHTIRKIAPDSTVVTLAGFAGEVGAVDGPARSARFSAPSGLAMDADGNLFIADTGNCTIRKLTPAGAVSTLAGQAGQPGDAVGAGEIARFRVPVGLAMDAVGNLLALDSPAGIIRRISPAGNVSAWAGSYYRLSSHDGPVQWASFSHPSGLAASAGGSVYIADTMDQTVRLIGLDEWVSTVGGSHCRSGAGAGADSAARFSSPYGVAVDRAGTVYVTDQANHRIMKGVHPAPNAPALFLTCESLGLPIPNGDTVDFGAVRTDRRAALRFRLENVGLAEATNLTLSLAGEAAGEFTLSTNALPRLPGLGGLAVFDIGFTPASEGLRRAALRISGNDPEKLPFEVSLAGTVVLPPSPNLVLLSPTGEALTPDGTNYIGSCVVGGRVTLGLGLWNTGLEPLHASAAEVLESEYGEFVLIPNPAFSDWTFPIHMPSLAVQFTPQDVGPRTAVLLVYSNDAKKPQYRIRVSAMGCPPYQWTRLAGAPDGVADSADGPNDQARFNLPAGLIPDGSGNVYVADMGNHLIRRIDADGQVRRIAGRAGVAGAADGSADEARFNRPTDLALDSQGNLYVADQDNHTIRRIAPGGRVTTLAGGAGLAGNVDGPGSAARFSFPNGLAVDALGRLLVADTGNSAIRQVSLSGDVSAFAGLPGLSGHLDGKGLAARFTGPVRLTLDPAGAVFVADASDHTLRRMSGDAEVSSWAGRPGAPGSADGARSELSFSGPIGIAMDNRRNLYLLDTGNHTVRWIAPEGIGYTIGGLRGSAGDAEGVFSAARFRSPNGIAVDDRGRVWVADTGNHRIVVGTPLTGPPMLSVAGPDGAPLAEGSLLEVATLGVGDAARCTLTLRNTGETALRDLSAHWEGAAGPEFTLTALPPTALAPRPEGTPLTIQFAPAAAGVRTAVLRLDSDAPAGSFRVALRFTVLPPYRWLTLAGNPAGAPGAADGLGPAASFRSPTGLALDGTGGLYVADRENHAIRSVTAAGRVGTLAGRLGVSGTADGEGPSARFNLPGGVAVDAAGNLFVADTGNHTVRSIGPAGVVGTSAGAPGESGSADGVARLARFNGPRGLAFGPGGDLFVADTDNHTVRRLTSAGVVSTFAGGAGQSGAADGLGVAARFLCPGGLAADARGNLYVADTYNCLLRKIDPSANVSRLVGDAGKPGSADGIAGVARFYLAYGVATDAQGNVYVADTYNHTLRVVSPVGLTTTVGGLALRPGNADGLGSAARFHFPAGVAVDASGTIYVADTGNHTLRKGLPAAPDQPVVDRPEGWAGVLRQLDVAQPSAQDWFWQLVQRPVGSTAALSSTTVRNPTFTPDVPGAYLFRLSATNDWGQVCLRSLEFHAASAERPQLSWIDVDQGQATLRLSGTIGSRYVIQTTTTVTDPTSWRPLVEFGLTNSVQEWTVPTPATDSQRYYRAVLSPAAR